MTSRFETAVPAVRAKLQTGWPARQRIPQQHSLSTSTVEQYIAVARRFDSTVVPLLASHDTVVDALTAWRERMETTIRAERAKPASVRVQVAALRSVYAALQVLKLYASNPAQEIGSARADHGLPRPMEPAQVAQLCQAIDCTTAEGQQARAMVELLLHNLRRAEVAGLTTASLRVVLPTHVVVAVHGKGGTERLVPLHPSGSVLVARYVLDAFRGTEWAAWRADFPGTAAEQILSCLDRALRTGLEYDALPLFRNQDGAGVSVRWINRRFAQYRDAAQLSPAFGPHSLRHTFATELLANGEDLRTVQELMGHKDIRSTTIYTKVALSTQVHATQKLPTPALEESWFTKL